MFGIGPLELIVIALFALIFIGPKRLPEMARQFGKFFVKIRRMTSEVRNTVDNAIREAEHDLLLDDRKKLQAMMEEQQNRAQQAAKSLLDEAGSQPSSAASSDEKAESPPAESPNEVTTDPKWET